MPTSCDTLQETGPGVIAKIFRENFFVFTNLISTDTKFAGRGGFQFKNGFLTPGFAQIGHFNRVWPASCGFS
jgi:hypothetical protein